MKGYKMNWNEYDPYAPDEKGRRPIGVRMRPEAAQRWHAWAEAKGVNLDDLINEFLENLTKEE